jgi:hypothetical protein
MLLIDRATGCLMRAAALRVLADERCEFAVVRALRTDG